MTEPKVAHRDSPYFGLDYYDERYGAWFFGRESDGSKIITNLRAARLTLLHAESGVGKTSLLRAGVAWRLHRLADDMSAKARPVRSIPVVFSSWKDDPTTELAAAVGAAVRPYLGNGGMPAPAGGPLDAAVEAASGAVNASLLIMLDQFEEYFLYRSREPVPERFADELARCVNRTDLRANFVIAIREDAYAELGDLFKGRITNVYGNYLHIDYLDRAAAEKAIRGPVDVYNSQPGVAQPVTVQDELVEAVLDEVRAFGRDGSAAVADGDRDRIATPLLQLVMQRVWDTERAEGSADLRLSTLQRLHGVRMIVDDHLGKALGALNGGEREAAIDMFDHLVTPSGGKIAESVSDLAKRTGHPEEQVDGVLRKLDDERILRPVPAAPGQDPVRSRRYEIFHDVLASPINRAIAAREEQRRVRRFRRLAALAVVLLVVVSAVAVVFAYLLNSANTEKLTAESRQLAADADLNVARNPELSTSLALQALKLRSTSQAADSLRTALPNLQALRTFHDGSAVSAAAFDPTDANIVAGSDNSGIVWMWDIKTGRRVERLMGGSSDLSGGATAMAFNPGGTKVAVGYGTGTVDVFDVRGGAIQRATSPGPVVSGLEFTSDPDELAIAGGIFQVWAYEQTDTPNCCVGFTESGPSATTVSADPRSPHEFALTQGTGVFIVNARGSGSPVQIQFQLSRQQTTDAQFSPDGSEIVTAAANGQVDIYRLATRSMVATFSAGGTAATTAAFSPDGKQIVAGYQDGTGRVWDVATRRQLTLLAGHTGPITSAQFSPDGRKVVTASGDGTIRVWYAEPRELRTEITISPNGSAPVTVARAQYISNRIIATDGTGDVFVYTSGQREADITAGLAARAVGWNSTGTKIATLDPYGTVQLWHAVGSSYTRVSLQSPISLNEDLPQVNIAMSPDGSRLAIAVSSSNFKDEGEGYAVQVLSADTGKPLQTIDAVNPVWTLTFSTDGRQIAATDTAGQVEVWNGAAIHPRVLGAPGPDLSDVSFNRSGSKLASASASGVVTIWDTQTGRALHRINTCASPNSAAFSPDGSKVVAACPDGTVQVFDVGTGQTLTVMQVSNGGSVSDAGFSPDGKSIVAGVETGSGAEVQIWNAELTTPSLPTLERIAGQRITNKLTVAELQQYLSGASS
jgi:WD40 repeat protein